MEKIIYHKHKGFAYSTGKLKNHPIKSNHKDDKVKVEHNKVLTKEQQKYKLQISQKIKETMPDSTEKLKNLFSKNNESEQPKQVMERDYTEKDEQKVKQVMERDYTEKDEQKVEADENIVGVQIIDGYLSLNLDGIKNVNGLKLTFTRRFGKTKRTIGIIFDNKPCKLQHGEFYKGNEIIFIDKQY